MRQLQSRGLKQDSPGTPLCSFQSLVFQTLIFALSRPYKHYFKQSRYICLVFAFIADLAPPTALLALACFLVVLIVSHVLPFSLLFHSFPLSPRQRPPCFLLFGILVLGGGGGGLGSASRGLVRTAPIKNSKQESACAVVVFYFQGQGRGVIIALIVCSKV